VEQDGLRPLTLAELKHLEACVDEEITEFCDAHAQSFAGDLRNVVIVESVDALMDLIYFAVGGLHKLGLSPTQMHQCFAAVHTANMTKERGVVLRRGDGEVADAVKPNGWMSPELRIAEVLEVTYVKTS
jgi:predicted HAD superfamily Cof-like phosphohydrolase